VARYFIGWSIWGLEAKLGKLSHPPSGRAQTAGDFMANPVQLKEEDVTYLLTVLRNASQPITTQQLINALRDRAS
jgi:hypothetical protein